MAWKQKVAASFGAAVASYEQHATVQNQVAGVLANTIVARTTTAWSIERTQLPRALEIGCGTGFLTRRMLSAFPNADWTISDVCPQMIEHCRKHPSMPPQPQSHLQFIPLDGELIHEATFGIGQFNLICSNLAFQWFVDLPNAVNRMMDMVADGGWLFFSTLGNRNYARVLTDYPELKLRVNVHNSVDAIRAAVDARNDTDVELTSVTYDVRYDSLRDFIKSVTAIGAGVSRSDEGSAADLRKAIRRSQRSGQSVIADYQVVLVAARKRIADRTVLSTEY